MCVCVYVVSVLVCLCACVSLCVYGGRGWGWGVCVYSSVFCSVVDRGSISSLSVSVSDYLDTSPNRGMSSLVRADLIKLGVSCASILAVSGPYCATIVPLASIATIGHYSEYLQLLVMLYTA